MNNDKEIEFQNIGRRKQHKNELIKIIRRCFDIDIAEILRSNPGSGNTYTDELITHYWDTVTQYLQATGIEDPSGLWCIINGDLIRIPENEVVGRDKTTGKPIPAMPLWAAIQERDKSRGGQTGDYLAALVYHHCESFIGARNQVRWNLGRATQEQTQMHVTAMSNSAMLAQTFFFQLYLLEVIHPDILLAKHGQMKLTTSEIRSFILKPKQKACSEN